MQRRSFLKSLGIGGLGLTLLPSSGRAEPYEGPLLMTINALGGWDISNFCDPKGNWMNERYDTGDIRTAGNLAYAPIDANGAFFDRFHRDMLLINGIDMRTAGHVEAARHAWSGDLADNGTPALAALFAAHYAGGQGVPTPYISSGGFSRTGNLVPLTRLGDPATLQSIGNYELERGIPGQAGYVHDFALEEVFEARRRRHELARPHELPRYQSQRSKLFATQLTAPLLRRYREFLPEVGGTGTAWISQAATGLAAMRAGIGASVAVYVSDFDTHSDHENRHQEKLVELIDTITFAMNRAEELGLRDRLTIVVTSEFSRTPEYGMNGGKDHWPVNSMIVMGPGVEGNRVIGATDDGLLPRNIDLETLEFDDSGEHMMPGHVHAALREHLGLTEFARDAGFDLRIAPPPIFA
jgi:hypothetical protein